MKLRKLRIVTLTGLALPLTLLACSGDDDAADSAGKDGESGSKGEDGLDGTNGENGTNGMEGEPGENGDPGEDGENGEPGEPGMNGEDGLDADIVEGSMIEWVKARVQAIKDGDEAVGEYLPLPTRLTDSVETARGLAHNVVVKWLDPLTFDDAVDAPRYGANGDWTAYFGDLPTGAYGSLYEGDSTGGWFWSNHEYISGDAPDHRDGGAAPNGQAYGFSQWLVDRDILGIGDVGDDAAWDAMDAEQETYIEWHKRQLGGSWFRVVQDPGSGTWAVDRSAAAKRYDASSQTLIAVVGTTLSDAATVVEGTQNNCSGTHTPWGTVLSGEENVQQYFGDLEPFWSDSGVFTAAPAGTTADAGPGDTIVLDYDAVEDGDFGRNPDASEIHPKDHYGFVTEFDPTADSDVPYDSTSGDGHQKLGQMGRARWENATFATGEDWKLIDGQPIVLYAGDDRRGGRIFKFVTSENWTTGMTKAQTRNLLADGTLYVAHFADLKNDGNGLTIAGDVTPTEATPGGGVWIELSVDNDTQDAPNAATLGAGTKVGAALSSNTWNNMGGFDSDDLVRSVLFTASNKIGVRELNRPEDLEYNPFDGNVYIAFTNHNRTTMLNNNGVLGGGTLRPDRSGAVFALAEGGASPAVSTTFTFWAAWLGAREFGTNDPFVGSCPDNVLIDPVGGVWFGTDGNAGNNGRADSVYYLDLEESKAYRVASAPSDAESTGPTFTPDGNTLFFNVQHPGEGIYSAWPNDSKYGPLSSLVAVYPRR